MQDRKEKTQENTKKRVTRNRTSAPQRRGDKWRIQWTDHTGKRRSKTFDTFDEANRELERVKGARRLVQDGSLPAPPEPITFKEFVKTYYIPNRTEQTRCPRNDHSIFKNHLYTAFNDFNLVDIDLRVIESFKGKKLSGGMHPNTLRHILTLLKSVLRYAHSMEFLLRVPAFKMPKIPERPYSYIRTDDGIRALLREAKKETDGVYELYATAIYTGMRAGELLGLMWDDVDFNTRLIRVARSHDQPTKSGKVRHVPILDTLWPILREWRLKNDSKYVFPTEIGTRQARSPRATKTTFKDCLERAGLDDMRFHDLRHTFASHWAMKGGTREKLQEILGHSDPTMTQRYRHLEPQIFQDDLGIFGKPEDHSSDNVVQVGEHQDVAANM